VINGCNIFWGQKLAKHLQLCGQAHYCATTKNLKSRTQVDKPVESASGDDPLFLYKILHLLFFPLVCIVRALCLVESKKNYQHGLEVGPLEYQLLWPRGCLTNPYRTLLFCFGVIDKNHVSSPVIILLKTFLSSSAIAIMSWQDVTQSSLCSDVKECGRKHTQNYLFPKSSFSI